MISSLDSIHIEEVEAVVETAEVATEVIEKVAEEVEKLAEEVANQFPEGGKVQNAATFVENIAKETIKDAHLAEDVIEKVIFPSTLSFISVHTASVSSIA